MWTRIDIIVPGIVCIVSDGGEYDFSQSMKMYLPQPIKMYLHFPAFQSKIGNTNLKISKMEEGHSPA